jgi:addiction module HigA family antidote
MIRPRPLRPGKHLAEMLSELAVSQADLARATGVSPMRVSHIVKGTRPLTPELALLFGKALGQPPEYWLSLQAAYDLAAAERTMKAVLARIPTLTAA